MVNWHDPALLLKDYFAIVKLYHAVAGLYIWETVFTSGFELDVLRGKRPYRWTIWLYLGTRYTALAFFTCFLINLDGPRVNCQSLVIATPALVYSSWAFASFIIVLRVIAIWNRNVILSLIAVGIWLGGLALDIRNLTMVSVAYNPILDTCVVLNTDKGLVNGVGVLMVDVVLLLSMLIGLLRNSQRGSTGIWKLLYQQCIIWLALASFAEIPVVVFLFLNLNGMWIIAPQYRDAHALYADGTLCGATDAWDEMLSGPAIAILSIGASRMYRSLSDSGSLTEYISADLPQFSPGALEPTARRIGYNTHGPLQFVSVTQSEGTPTTSVSPVSLETGQIFEFVSGGSNSSLTCEDTAKANSAGYEMA